MKTSQYASNIITAIDPRYIASLHGKGGCTFYRSSDLKRYACGMSRMFDAVPSRIVSEVRRCVQNCFTCRSYYFASRKGKRLISPAEQAEIASVSVPFARSYVPYTTALRKDTNGDRRSTGG